MGMKRFLILMRHAKSDWSDDSLRDHDRPLNQRGRDAAPRMADWLTTIDLVPEQILCSSSTRTCETVELMTPQWEDGGEPQVGLHGALYHATAETILDVVRQEGGDAERLMVVAHNPGTSHLVSVLGGKFTEMPTAAIAVFGLEIEEWKDVQPDMSFDLLHFMRPKAL